MKSKKKVITLIVVAALVLSLGTVGALAAANASRVNPDNVKEVLNDDGIAKIRFYVNVDENGIPVDLTDEEWQEVHDLLASRDENGNIIPPSDGERVGEKDGVIDVKIFDVNPVE